MPGLDRTGPWGEGPMTGRGLGLCTPEGRELLARGPWGRGFGWGRGWRRGRGFGWGRGWGRGWCWRFFGGFGWGRGRGFGWRRWFASLSPEERKKLLEEEAAFYREQLEEIEKELKEEASKE
ncbi:DUF5320 domain-containing protein [Thermodesulfatator autotrophicus]|uniref:Cytoplasmic protein n=1 Tax=Thermodesulfatator autotrophicus TaxID=1795632 RepID=A0A177EB54_9BACT|nr:DUF5320 domain-containing protein [Thermodesulfatator autotrophicus]OAG28741.1 hypothetical protein TH606_00305 [Thermodesulfatator autotrophicus]